MALARLEELKKSLEGTIGRLKELKAAGTLQLAMDEDEERWGPVVDAAAFSLVSLVRLLTALQGATSDDEEAATQAIAEEFYRELPRPWFGPRGGRG